jgi:hypothetical protein
LREAWRVGQVASALPGGFVDVDGEIFALPVVCCVFCEHAPQRLRLDVGMGSIPDIQADEVELLICRTEIFQPQGWNNPAEPYVEATAYTPQKGIPS